MKRSLLDSFFAVADVCGLNWLARKITGHKIRVLMYHGVVESQAPISRWTVIDAPTFRWQMTYLARHFEIVKASSIWSNVNSKQLSNRPQAVITFDDGLLNTLTQAQPILASLHLPAICFVAPGLAIERRQIWADDLFEYVINSDATSLDWEQFGLGKVTLAQETDERTAQAESILEKMKSWPHARRTGLVNRLMASDPTQKQTSSAYQLMSIDQIRDMANSGTFEIGLHSDFHPIMSSMSDEDQRREIAGAVEKLGLHNISFVPIFAYPNGRAQDFNDATVAVLTQLGFVAGLTTIDRLAEPSGDPFRVKRIGIGGPMTHWEYKARLSGLFYFVHALFGGVRD